MNSMDIGTYEKMFQDSLEYGRNREYSKAVALLERIVSETEAIPAALLYLGRSYHALQEYDKAVAILRSFVQISPDNDTGYFFLGRSYLALTLYHQAVRSLKRSLEINPGSGTCLMYLGYAYLKCNDTASALDFFGRAVEIRPEDERLYNGYLNTLFVQGIKEFQKGNLDAAREMLLFYLGRGGDNLLLHLYLGILERESGNPGKALEHYDRAIAMNGDDASIRFQRAEILFMVNRNDEAIQELERVWKDGEFEPTMKDIVGIQRILAVKLFQDSQYRRAIHFAVKVLKNRSDPDMHLLIGEGYRNLGDFEKAGNHYLRAEKLLPGSVEPLYGSAILCWETDRWKDMLNILTKIDRIQPGDPISSYYTALCSSRLSLPSDITIPLLQEEIKKNSPDPYLFASLADEYVKGNRIDLCEKWYEKALTLKSDMREAHVGLISFYITSGDDKKLLQALGSYLEVYPGDIERSRLRIRVFLRNAKYREAVSSLEGLLAADPGNESVKRALAFCMRKSGKFREAAVWYRRLLSEKPDNELYLRSLVYCLKKAGRSDEASLLLARALDYLKHPSPVLHAILSHLYYTSGKLDEAIRRAHTALDGDPNNGTIMNNLSIMYREKGIPEFADRYKKNAERCRRKKSCDRVSH